jgi:hypothetical protein
MDELERIRAEYARRACDARYAEWYADANVANNWCARLNRLPFLRSPYLIVLFRP